MQIEQKQWTSDGGWNDISSTNFSGAPQLVLVFGGRQELEKADRFNEVKDLYPDSHILMCSTAGEILGEEVRDNSLALTAVHFENTTLQFTQTTIGDVSESKEKGLELGGGLEQSGLAHAMIFSDGLNVNGTALVEGLIEKLPAEISVTGGLVGDGADFKKTLVGLDEPPKEKNLVLIGFYSDSLKVGHGSLGGWDPFGPQREITKSKDNVLFELDGKPALETYKEYLGEEQAKGLPGSGLLFPLNVTMPDDGSGKEVVVVRTLLAVNEDDQSMTFAGDMPTGTTAQFMKANFDRLVDGASGAAERSIEGSNMEGADLAILISCVGRKLILKERIDEETEAVQEALGSGAVQTGFYSYGEISPVAPTEKQCKLHNQTMTITTFKE